MISTVGRPARIPTRLGAIILALALALPAAVAQPVRVGSETQVKAAYVLKFLKYTQWPAGREPAPDGEYVVAVVGTRAFEATLRDSGAQAKRLGHRSVRVWHLDPASVAHPETVRKLDATHAVYIAGGARVDPRPLLEQLRRRPVLTIGDTTGFAAAGGMLGLVREGDRIVFDANPAAIQAQGLKLSAKVLKLSRIVEPPR